MNKMRSHIASKFLAIVTGIIFLNMSFFISEIKLLDLHLTNYELVENIVKMISCVGLEEERDPGGETPEPGASKTPPDVYLLTHPYPDFSGFLISINNHCNTHSHDLLQGSYEILTPPPKR